MPSHGQERYAGLDGGVEEFIKVVVLLENKLQEAVHGVLCGLTAFLVFVELSQMWNEWSQESFVVLDGLGPEDRAFIGLKHGHTLDD